MTLKELLDRYIDGEEGSYYFDIIEDGKYELSGGQFYTKQQARDALVNKLVKYLDKKARKGSEELRKYLKESSNEGKTS